ncbi:MAG: universal stress protein [Myxococcota bacterium]
MKHVLLATDFSPAAMFATEAAATLAERLDARATLAHVLRDADRSPPEEGLELLRERRFGQVADVSCALLEGEHADVALIEAARARDVDLIVVARHGRHTIEERLLGATTERLLRKAPCSVFVAHPSRRERLTLAKHVMVGTDFSPASRSALAVARALADAFSAWTTLVHVWDLVPTELIAEPLREGEGPRAMLLRMLEETRRDHLGESSTEAVLVRDKSAVAAICDEADTREADVLVLGTHGRTGLTRFFLGSVAERVVRHAPCSVLVVRDDDAADAGSAGGIAALGSRIL